MTDWRDTHPDVRTLPLDSLAADRILAGELPPEDSPAGVAEVAAIVRALRVEPTVAELARERQAVAELAAIVRAQDEEVARAPERSRGTFPRLRVAAAIALAVLGATTALAAAGQLPGRAQDVASNVLGTIGIRVPKSDDERRKPPAPAGDETGPRPQTGGAGTADEEPSGSLSPQEGETDTGPVPSSGSDRAEDEGGEQPTTGGGTTPSPGAPSPTQPGTTVPEPEETGEPTETTEPTTTDERKPKPPKQNQGPPGAGGPGGGAQTETDTEAEDEDDVRPTRPPPPTVPQPPQLPPRNPRATDAQDEARVTSTDTRGGSRGSR